MTKFEVGDRFIPRKPKNTSQYPIWSMDMDKFNGRVLTFDKMDYDGNLTSKDAEFYSFHPDWCKKVEYAHLINEESKTENAETKQDNALKSGSSEFPNNHKGLPDVGKTIDWEQRRWEAVMRLAASRLGKVSLGDDSSYCKAEVKFTIDLADEMIKQLKQR